MGFLEGKAALITGGGSGIGRGVVDLFLEEGARVAVLEINQQKVDALGQLGSRVLPVAGDATRLEDNKRAVAASVSFFGRLDILVCVPGVWDYSTSLKDFPEGSLSTAFDELFNVNVKSYILSTKVAIPELLKSQGNIIYTVSNAGFYADGGGALYTASKFAVRGLVTQMAFELAPKVRVNGVAPGGTVTDLRGLKALNLDGKPLSSIPEVAEKMRRNTPVQVLSTPKDHAWAFAYLASNEMASQVTGAIIPTDGGLGVRGLSKLGGLVE